MIQGISALSASQVRLFMGGSAGVSIVAIAANEIFNKISEQDQNKKLNPLAAAAVSVLFFSACTTLAWTTIGAGIAAFALISVISAKRTRPQIVPPPNLHLGIEENLTLKERLIQELRAKNVTKFISYAVKEENSAVIEQLAEFLFSLEKFQGEDQKLGLSVFLLESILSNLKDNEAFIAEILSPPSEEIRDELLDEITVFYKDLAQICGQMAEGPIRPQMLIDGTLIEQLRKSQHAQIRDLADYEYEDCKKDNEKQSDRLTRIMRNQPTFQDIDFTSLIEKL